MSAFFLPLMPDDGGDVFLATEHTIGPWSAEHQHGGPPCALLGRAIAREAGPGYAVARISFDLERPVPIGLVRVAARTVSGRKARRIEAILTDPDDRVLVRAMAICIEQRPLELPHMPELPEPLPPYASMPRFDFPFFAADVGYHTSIDCRIVRGALGSGVVAAFMRPLLALVEGEESTPLERLLVVVDSASGMSQVLDVRAFTFVNPDL
ncbi:MAG: thioesterase family protein, partial [Polyangiaceae bacterium]|nr:thioesterase family protein [Polyangiaceae bacterium]